MAGGLEAGMGPEERAVFVEALFSRFGTGRALRREDSEGVEAGAGAEAELLEEPASPATPREPPPAARLRLAAAPAPVPPEAHSQHSPPSPAAYAAAVAASPIRTPVAMEDLHDTLEGLGSGVLKHASHRTVAEKRGIRRPGSYRLG
eukprot:g7479.t1